MARIQIMDEHLANQIAAGEVVERPASVVKELVENAIDAGATAVDVTIEEGGLSLIRVQDDGGGIDAEDMETAFQRHATSKLLDSRDLFRIASLGFRGEALPSIAAVARVDCTSAGSDSGLGRRIVMEGGKLKVDEHAGTGQGTDMIVRDLFFNTPARLKYMKSIQTELGHISDYLYRIALAHPGIAFSLTHNGGNLLRTLGNGDRLQVIAAVYGTATAKGMLPLRGSHPDYELHGYVSKPELTRASRNAITTVVNGRYIRSFTVQQALMAAYHTLLPINRFPVAVLEIGMHPGLVDVNVHPSKMEVRFSKEPELKAFLEATISEALGGRRHIPGPDSGRSERSGPVFRQEQLRFHQPEPGLAPSAPLPAPPDDIAAASAQAAAGSAAAWTPARPGGASRQGPPAGSAAAGPWRPPTGSSAMPQDAAQRLYAPAPGGLPAQSAGGVREQSADYKPTQDYFLPNPFLPQPSAERAPEESSSASSEHLAPQVEAVSPEDSPAASQGFPELSWVGQLHGTYLIAQNEEGMYMIDQHAAHERINYEYYFRKFGEPSPESQELLVPFTLEYTSADALVLSERLELLSQGGVELEPFGPQSFLVRSHPHWLPKGEEQRLVEEMAEWVIREKTAVNIAKLREEAAIMCSCKASIKANDRLSREEGESLLARLAACQQPYTCPHGRPILVHISNYQLEKMFKRVMS